MGHVEEKLGRRGRLSIPLVPVRAAVAVILRPEGDALEVLLVRRAERRGDPWSGHVALPGGRAAPEDPDLEATARRETREEVAVALEGARVLGRLDDLPAKEHGGLRPMAVTPVVFALDAPRPGIELSDEVVRAFWVPLGALASGAHDAEHEHKLGPLPVRFAAWRFDGETIWGMTHRILRGLIGQLG